MSGLPRLQRELIPVRVDRADELGRGPVQKPLERALPLPSTSQVGAGLVHGKHTPASGQAYVGSVIDAQKIAKYGRELAGEVPIDAAAYAALTGISADSAESARLDALVKATAKKIGLDHPVGFAAETKFMGFSYEYAFLGVFHGWNRKEGQPILVGVGMKAKTPDDLELLYRFDSRGKGIPPGIRPMLEDFLKLSEDEKIQSILVHEALELEAAVSGSSNPHRSAVSDAPHTELAISPRVRQHLALYARLDEQVFGGGR